MCEKTNNFSYDQVRHNPGCTVTEAGWKLEILDLRRRGIVLSCSENKGADQLRGYREADLRLCFRPSILLVFLCSGSNTVQPHYNTPQYNTVFNIARPYYGPQNDNLPYVCCKQPHYNTVHLLHSLNLWTP